VVRKGPLLESDRNARKRAGHPPHILHVCVCVCMYARVTWVRLKRPLPLFSGIMVSTLSHSPRTANSPAIDRIRRLPEPLCSRSESLALGSAVEKFPGGGGQLEGPRTRVGELRAGEGYEALEPSVRRLDLLACVRGEKGEWVGGFGRGRARQGGRGRGGRSARTRPGERAKSEYFCDTREIDSAAMHSVYLSIYLSILFIGIEYGNKWAPCSGWPIFLWSFDGYQY